MVTVSGDQKRGGMGVYAPHLFKKPHLAYLVVHIFIYVGLVDDIREISQFFLHPNNYSMCLDSNRMRKSSQGDRV